MTSTGSQRRRALLTGWFSFQEVIATVGDELGCETTEAWLRSAGWDVDVAFAPYLRRGVDWREADAADYDLLVFTTGPLSAEPLLQHLLDHFRGVPAWAVNVSALDAATARRFTRIWPRDDGEFGRPDLAIASDIPAAPVLAVAYSGRQAEYPHGRQAETATVLRDWLESRQHAVVELDTDMFAHHRWPRRPSQTASLIRRTDAVVSMRLHGLVLALAEGVPALAVDGVPGGGKVCRQAQALGWPYVLDAGEVDFDRLDELVQRCLTPQARALAAACRTRAVTAIEQLRAEFTDVLRQSPPARDSDRQSCAGSR